MSNLEEKNEVKEIRWDTFFSLLTSKGMDDAKSLTDDIYESVSKKYSISEEFEGYQASLEDEAINNRKIMLTEIYNLINNIYNFEAIKRLSPEAQNIIVEEILKLLKTAIDDKASSWDFKEINEFIKLLFTKYRVSDEKLIGCIEHYIRCPRKDLIDRIIHEIIKSPDTPCDTEKVIQILQTYNVMMGNATKALLPADNIINMAELCAREENSRAEVERSYDKVARLFFNSSLIITRGTEVYVDIIDENIKKVNEGMSVKSFLGILENSARAARNEEDRNNQAKTKNNGRGKKKPKNRAKGKNGNISKEKITEYINSILKTNITNKHMAAATIGAFALILAFIAGRGSGLKDTELKNGNSAIEQEFDGFEDGDLGENDITKYKDYIGSYPVSVKCIATDNLEPYGIERGEEVIASMSLNGEAHSIKYLNEDGTITTITINLENYMSKLHVAVEERKSVIISEYTQDGEEFSEGDTVLLLDEPHENSDGIMCVTARKTNGYPIEIPYDITSESKYKNEVQAYIKSLRNVDDTAKIEPQKFTLTAAYESPESGIYYEKGENIFGYLTVEVGQPVVKITKTVNEEEEITIPFYGYFDDKKLKIKSNIGILNRMITRKSKITADVPIYIWNGDKLTGIIQPLEEIGIMTSVNTDGTIKFIATIDDIKIGEIKASNIPNEITNYIQSIQSYVLEGDISEQYQENTYHNGIAIPVDYNNSDLHNYIKDQTAKIKEGNMMPDTKSGDVDMLSLELSTEKNMVTRIKNMINKKTGMTTPFGLHVYYSSEDIEIDDIVDIIKKIQNSEYGAYFQNGLAIIPYRLNDMESSEDPDYEDEMEEINTLIDTIEEMGVPVTIMDSLDSALDIDDINSEKVSNGMIVEMDEGEFSEELKEYIDSTYTARSKVVSMYFDENRGIISINGERLKGAILKTVREELMKNPSPTEDNIKWDAYIEEYLAEKYAGEEYGDEYDDESYDSEPDEDVQYEEER